MPRYTMHRKSKKGQKGKQGRPLHNHKPEIKMILRKWIDEHAYHPYPTKPERLVLREKTGLTESQISSFMTNERRRNRLLVQSRSLLDVSSRLNGDKHDDEDKRQKRDVSILRIEPLLDISSVSNGGEHDDNNNNNRGQEEDGSSIPPPPPPSPSFPFTCIGPVISDDDDDDDDLVFCFLKHPMESDTSPDEKLFTTDTVLQLMAAVRMD